MGWLAVGMSTDIAADDFLNIWATDDTDLIAFLLKLGYLFFSFQTAMHQNQARSLRV